MTARRLYTEEQIRDAWQQAYLLARDPWNFHEKFLITLRAGKKAEPAVLFTKDDLLAVAATEREKIVVHGIFAMLGTTAANDNALLAQAGKANMRGNMQIMIDLAKERRGGRFEIGSTYRDADGRLYRYTAGGFRQYILLDLVIEPVRPLEKI